MDHHLKDRLWLGLDSDSDGGLAHLVVRPDHVNPGGTLYGGTAVAAAVTLMESLMDRFVVWTTVQFVATCGLGEVLELKTMVSAAGRRSAQLRVVATSGGREIFVALGAVGSVRGDGVDGQWETMPEVEGPELCPDLGRIGPPGSRPADSHVGVVERRLAARRGGDRPNQLAIWSRMPEHPVVSPAMIGWHADMMGMAVSKAKPGVFGGTSLDNTMRFARSTGSEWLLIDMQVHCLVEGYGHGTVHVWSPDGTLVATGSQSCIVKPLPPPPEPNR